MMARLKSMDNNPALGYLLEGLADAGAYAAVPVAGIRIDSRRVQPGDLFIALQGRHTSGANFIDEAARRGAIAILGSGLQQDSIPIPVFNVSDLRFATGLIASRFFGEPSRHMNIVGITGTNGKTSVAYYLAQSLTANDRLVGVIGTLGYGVINNLKPAANTTPDVVTINELLAGFLSAGIFDAVMEVSSHALDQGRVSHVQFATAVFTNLSRDHLDYHTDLRAYGLAKKRLFSSPGLKAAVINTDDDLGRELAQELTGRLQLVSYGIVDRLNASGKNPAVTAVIKEQGLNNLLLDVRSPWGQGELRAGLAGRFNAYNLLATLSVLCLHGLSFDAAVAALSRVRAVPGRMEYFGGKGTARIFVDYAHTPDALQQVLRTLRSLCTGRLICVFGCGGDRDRGKRPEMGRIAEQYADQVIVTSDNPRTEPPEKIIEDILAGMDKKIPIEIQPDRALAIQSVVLAAEPSDVVLIAGKGHETYQEIGTQRLPFSDRQLVRNLLEGRA